MAYEIWAFNNVDEVRTILQSVTALLGSSDFLGAMRTMAIAGLLVTAGAVFMMIQRFEGIATWFLLLALFYFGLFVPKVDVVIQDRTGIQPAATVPNVPLGLAFFASSTSKIGSWMTATTETLFTLPNNLMFQKNGMMFGSKMVKDSRSAGASDPTFRMDVINYIRNCVNPDILDGYKDPAVIRAATDLWAALGDTNPGRWTTVTGGATPLNCLDAWFAITPGWSAQIDKEATLLGRLTNSYETNPAAAKALLNAQMPDAFNTILGVSASMTDIIKQNMMANLMNDAAIAIPQLMGDPVAGAIAIAKAQADVQNVVQYSVIGKMAEETLPKVRNVVELLIIGVFPFIFLIMIVSGVKGFALLKNYVFMLIFVQLWAPLYAILNYIGTTGAASRAKAAMMGASGITLENIDGITAATLNQQHIVGMMTMAIPAIAWGIAKMGEMALGSVAGQVMAPASSAAAGAGSSAGAGNFNMGNSSINTTKANLDSQNKMDRDVQVAFGASTIRTPDGRSWTRFQDGTETLKIPQSDTGGLTASIKSGVQTALTSSAEHLTSAGKSNTTAGANMQSSALAEMISNGSSKVNTTEASKGHSKDEVSKFTAGHSAMASMVRDVSRQTGLSEKDVVQATARLSVGVGGLSGTYADATTKQVQSTIKDGNQDQWNKSQEYTKGLTNSEAFRNSVASSSTQAKGVSAQISKGKQLSDQGTAQLQEAASRREQASSTSLGGRDANINLLSRPENSRLLSGLDNEVKRHLQANNPEAALAAVSDRVTSLIGSGMAMPNKFDDGSAVPSTSDLKSQHQGDAAHVRQDYDPKADYKSAKSEVNGDKSAGKPGAGATTSKSGPKNAPAKPKSTANNNAGSWRGKSGGSPSPQADDYEKTVRAVDSQRSANDAAIVAGNKEIGVDVITVPPGEAGAGQQRMSTTRSNATGAAARAFDSTVGPGSPVGKLIQNGKPRFEPIQNAGQGPAGSKVVPNDNPAAKGPGAKPGPLGSVYVPNSPDKK